MSTINVLVAVNAEQIAQQVADSKLSAGSAASPTSLGSWTSSDVFIAMVTQSQYVVNQQGQSEMTLKASSGDSVRWLITSFDGGTDYSVYVYASSFNPADDIASTVYMNLQTNEYLPPNGDTTRNPVKVVNHIYVAQSTVTGSTGSQIQYTMSFAVYDNKNQRMVGHFYWDPFINIV